MRTVLPLFILVAACAPQYEERTIRNPQDLPARVAKFESRPTTLDSAFEAACNTPGDRFLKMSRDLVQCRIPPSPDMAAFLVLQYDGALEAPTLVMQKRTSAHQDDYIVEMSYFAEVRQKSGGARKIYFKQRRMDRMVDQLLSSTGGTPTTGK